MPRSSSVTLPSERPRRSRSARAAAADNGLPRWPKGAAPPVLVEVRRLTGSVLSPATELRGGEVPADPYVVESRHRGSIVQVGPDLRVERALGDPAGVVMLRSTVKPFTLVALVESGAPEAFGLTAPELALMAASHSGEDMHVRTLQAVFRRTRLTQTLLGCGGMVPLDGLTAARLARDGEPPSPIRHMCSGFHAASLLLSRHAGWPLEEYWLPEHPSQLAARDAVARIFGLKRAALVMATDACGLPTYAFPLVELARAYALLADPHGVAPDPVRSALAPALTRVRDAMLAAPEMVGGSRDRLDTALAVVRAGKLVVKGGAEGLRGIAMVPGARGDGTPAAGLAIKIEDGGEPRSAHAATVEAMRQVGGLDERDLRHVAVYARPPLHDPRGEWVGEVVPDFELAPLSELV
ncbi:MAG: asparaginase [Candidatus Limnocylindrales bacterium]